MKKKNRPSGLKYNIKQPNKGWFKKGVHSYPEATILKPEHIPWNWKGNEVGYDALHDWVNRHKGKAQVCEFCGSDKSVHWANKSHEYKRELDDYIELCRKCHYQYDKREVI